MKQALIKMDDRITMILTLYNMYRQITQKVGYTVFIDIKAVSVCSGVKHLSLTLFINLQFKYIK